MKVPNFRPPTAGDFPGINEEGHMALKVISDQLDIITQCLQSNVSPEDNSNTEVKLLLLRSGEAQKVMLSQLRGRPEEVIIIDQAKFDFTKLAWEVVDQNEINVKVTWDDTENQEAAIEVKILIRGQAA